MPGHTWKYAPMATPSTDLTTVLAEDVRSGVRLLTLNWPERLNAMDHELALSSCTPASTRSPAIQTCVAWSSPGRVAASALDST
ncbi:MAG: hypothetical protein U5R31_17545 [Acidimicrobiia bacterium]|nr:hypothetical protein [Acidimicrobiia bacterium]